MSYEQQLQQISVALATCDNEEDRANLISLESDLKELISLENFESKSSGSESEVDESYSDERKALYQHLINEKCRAPFKLNGQAESYHNAFIADIVSEDDEDGVTVKVLFLNPTHDRMKACTYFFSNRCTFADSCKFSHGEIVKYSSLKHYQSPNFKLLKRKTHVLVKTDSLWKPGSIVECSHDLKTCQVKLHSSGKVFDCPFSDILPPVDADSLDSSDLSTDDEQSEEDNDFPSRNVLQVDDNFGEWEKHTTGIGSKILQKLGYVAGSGLGKRGDGITEPISAKIYVQGKSLDYNMELNERKNQETVEESSRRQSRKHQKASERINSNENEVFSFLNNTIFNSIKPTASATVTSKSVQPESVKSQSKAQLNISNFKLEEDIKKTETSLSKLRQSLGRHPKDSIGFKNINSQVIDQERSLAAMQRNLHDINKEQNNRREKSKLTIF